MSFKYAFSKTTPILDFLAKEMNVIQEFDIQNILKKHGIELIVSKRIPSPGLPERSTTALRQECRIPYRVELCGGWLDQPFVNKFYPGSVLTISIHPDIEFNHRSGMATSSRKKAIELWQTEIPVGNPEVLAKTLFCVENPPGTEHVSGSQDQLGILMPGLNKLNYDNGYWPINIDSIKDDDLLNFVEKNLWLVQLPQRDDGYDVFADTNINPDSVKKLSAASEAVWNAILNKDAQAWGKATKKCFEAQLEMFPHMITDSAREVIASCESFAYGWKLTGAGGGGYLCLISDKAVPNAIQVRIRRG